MESLGVYSIVILAMVCLFIQFGNAFVVIMNQKRSVAAVCFVESTTFQYSKRESRDTK